MRPEIAVSHIKRMIQAGQVADRYRANQGDLPADGFVTLWRMKATGWCDQLDRPWTFRPGVLAVSAAGEVFVATGGDYENGAKEFSSVFAPRSPVTANG